MGVYKKEIKIPDPEKKLEVSSMEKKSSSLIRKIMRSEIDGKENQAFRLGPYRDVINGKEIKSRDRDPNRF